MILVQQDFQTRAAEIENYFKFVKALIEGKTVLKADDGVSSAMSADEFDSLAKTLKANGFILLYNLVESTMKNAIEAIFDELGAQGVSFDACREEVRKVVISNLKAHNPDKVFADLMPIAQKVLTETFRKEKAFAGNIDAAKIREVAKEYGFQKPSSKGDNLLTVKSNRNDLAHGDKAFAEVGRDYDIVRLMTIKGEVVVYLGEVLQNVSDYLASRSYLTPPLTSPPAVAAPTAPALPPS